MKLTIENGLLYIDNKRFCYAKVNDARIEACEEFSTPVTIEIK